jgi:hypothetical protein
MLFYGWFVIGLNVYLVYTATRSLGLSDNIYGSAFVMLGVAWSAWLLWWVSRRV